jgi:glycosyltransferase involved in cell wall biosynthesis
MIVAPTSGRSTILWNFGTLHSGGGRTVGLDFIEELAKAKDEARHLCFVDERLLTGYRGPTPEIVERKVSSWGRYLSSDQLELPRVARRVRARVVMSLASLGPWRLPVPHVVFIQNPYVAHGWKELHGVRPSTKWYHAGLTAYVAPVIRRAARIVVQTDTMREAMTRRWPTAASKIQVIRGSVSNEFARALAVVPLTAKGTGAEFSLLTASSDSPHKNLDLIPRTASVLKSSGIRARFAVTVSPTSAAGTRLGHMASELGVEDAISFVGQVDVGGMARLLREANAAFLPSFVETLGLPYLEAIAAGVPVISSDHACAKEVCGPSGTYFDPRDPRSAASAVRQALQQTVKEPSLPSGRTPRNVVEEFLRVAQQLSKQ